MTDNGATDNRPCICGQPQADRGWWKKMLDEPWKCSHYPDGIPTPEPVYDPRLRAGE